MDNKKINKEVRKISSFSSLPLLCFVLAYILMTLGFNALMVYLNNNSVSVDTGLMTLIAYIILYLLVIPTSMLLFYRTRGRKTGQTLKSCFTKPKKSAGWIAKWLLIAIGVIYLSGFLSNLLFTIIEGLTGVSLTAKEIAFDNSIFGVINTLVALPIFAPILEELLFRGTLFRNTQPLGEWFAVIITSLMFGLWHMNYTQLLFASVMGVFSCLLLIKTRSIIPSMLLHFIINSIGAVQSLCMMNLDVNMVSSGDINYIISHITPIMIIGLIGFMIIGLIIAGLVLLVIELIRHRGRANLAKCEYQIKPLKKLSVYFSAPITIIVFAILISVTVLNALNILHL
ncbi:MULTISPECIES: CPBP family intramembrane glutamic endopeptidase [unclassified Ruminococcus]|uniref:CPBP family intramembrane glutamic endopeptidase n=1 Tax=unclassified Ruminococcus TaxID=2608920 RepID=UPI00210C8A20|nr:MULTISPECIES: type II CAAX endopeptidase family protein [unclassified Ruminococcus]MCQ4023029.1 CPBP family intramembrane metalloprotease [Ruminococcus sp. zg-924]MCQ4115466.1 CPBP family intramembrane metalloprotease [Ruminococcus sp. zg-921]